MRPRFYDWRTMTAKQFAQLPDDIEQKLMDGQRLRATYDLIERRRVTLNAARELVGRWQHERQQFNLRAKPSMDG